MGILGLTTFVNCNFNDTNLDIYHRGDYDQYAIKIIEFFSLLHSCNFELYVVFDGGNDPNYNEISNNTRENETETCKRQ